MRYLRRNHKVGQAFLSALWADNGKLNKVIPSTTGWGDSMVTSNNLGTGIPSIPRWPGWQIGEWVVWLWGGGGWSKGIPRSCFKKAPCLSNQNLMPCKTPRLAGCCSKITQTFLYVDTSHRRGVWVLSDVITGSNSGVALDIVQHQGDLRWTNIIGGGLRPRSVWDQRDYRGV